MDENLQKLQDMLLAMQQQRDQAMNAIVVVQADIAALRRTLVEREARINALGAELAKLKLHDPEH